MQHLEDKQGGKHKDQVVPVYTIKAYMGRRSITPLTPKDNTRMKWDVILTPWPLYTSKKSPQYSLNGKLGGPQI